MPNATDNDTQVLRLASAALFAMEVKCRNAGVMDRVAMKQERDQLWQAYLDARDKLIAEGIVVGDDELAEMTALTQDLERATALNQTAQAVLKLVGFFAKIAAA